MNKQYAEKEHEHQGSPDYILYITMFLLILLVGFGFIAVILNQQPEEECGNLNYHGFILPPSNEFRHVAIVDDILYINGEMIWDINKTICSGVEE